MQAYDLIMLIVIGMSTIFGAIKGFAWQVASLSSIIVSYIVAYRFRFDVAAMIQAKPPWNQFLAMLILYVGTSFVIWVAFRLLSGTIDRVRLKEFDRHLGAVFGLAKGLVYCLLITMFATSLLGPNQQAAICQSRSGYYIAQALDHGLGVLPREIHDVIGPYLARLDNKLKSGGSAPTGAVAADPNSSIWPAGGIPGLENVPGLPQGFQNGFQNALPEILPGAGNGNPSFFPPTEWSQQVLPSLEGFDAGNLGSGDIFPQANQSNTNFSPQVYPPLGQPGLSVPNRDSGLRPTTGQQAQQPAYVLPR